MGLVCVFDEYFEVLTRPKFSQEEEDIRELAELLTEKGVVMDDGRQLLFPPGDNYFSRFLG